MASVMALVSSARFEAAAADVGAVFSLGTVWTIDHYGSTHAALETLETGGDLYLVTVRSPGQQLWLVGVLRSPKKRDEGWFAAANRVPIRDISEHRASFVFANNKGLPKEAGKLAMSLQTPKRLTEEDERLLQPALIAEAEPAATFVATIEQRRAALVDAIRRRSAVEGRSEHAGPPLDEAGLLEAEERIGYALPPLLRTLYGTVSNGGFFPGVRPLVVDNIESCDTVVWYAEAHSCAPAECRDPAGLIRIFEWGCAIESCIDLRTRRSRVVRFDPHFRSMTAERAGERVAAYGFLVAERRYTYQVECDSIEDWFDVWLEDHRGVDLQAMRPQAQRRAASRTKVEP